MARIVVFPAPAPADLARALDLGDYEWKAVATETEARLSRPASGWVAAVLVVEDTIDDVASLARWLRDTDPGAPILTLVPGSCLSELVGREEVFDDFCLTPFHPAELDVRLAHLVSRSAAATADAQVLRYGPLVLDTQTYQALVDGHPIDLTYMEYELLRFLAAAPGRVFSRETLLSEVWGYEYYGGARTVDVHVRRLRSKLGEEHAGLISTVRSVGYRFGQSRWDDVSGGR